jgi:hypothetical protein
MRTQAQAKQSGAVAVLSRGVFITVAKLPGWVSRATSPAPPSPPVASYDTASTAGRIDRELSAAHEQLTQEIARAEAELSARKEALARIRADVDSLALTPRQRALLSRNPPPRPELSFAEWVTDRNIYYGLAINFLMGFLFFWLGIRGMRRKRG